MSVVGNYVPGRGTIGAKIMLLADAPMWGDQENGEMFSDKAWYDTKNLLNDAGISINSCWRTSVSKYFVPPSPKGKGTKKIPFAVRCKMANIDLARQINELQEEINGVQPNLIIGLGKTPLWVATGKQSIEDYRGSIMFGLGKKFIPTYNPVHLNWQASDVEFTGYWNRVIIAHDLRRARIQSEFPDVRLPFRTRQIARSSWELSEFLKKHSGLQRPAVDIEARGACIPYCIGLAFTPFHGITMPLWNKGEIESLFHISDADLISMWLIMSDVLANNDIVGQNFKYDQDKLKRLGFSIRRLASDTMLKGFAINPELPKGLGFLTSLYTEEPFYKNEGMYEGKLEDLLLGCANDACVTKEVDNAMDSDLDHYGVRDYYEKFILRLHDLYLRAEENGFRVDEEVRDRLLRKYIAWDEQCRHELYTLTGEYINTNSPKQVGILLYDTLKLPRKGGTSEEDITAILNTKSAIKNDNQRRILELILEDRRVRKTISTYAMALPDFDGRMKTTFYLCNETGRTSTGQQDPPIRPQIEVYGEDGKKKMKNLGIAFQTMTKHGDIGQDIREMYVPDPGTIFVGLDSAQAEARVVFLLADDEQALIDIDARDYHALTASWFFGGTEDDYSKKKLGYESPTRFAGKTLRHAGHLGAGKRRAAISVNTDARKYKIPITITEELAGRALEIFHQKQPKIRQVFHLQIEECLKRNRMLRAPVPYGIDAKFGPHRIFYERFGEDMNRQAFSYIPQRAITDNTKNAALNIMDKFGRFSVKMILEAHDGLLFQVPELLVDDFMPHAKMEMERPINFENCSLPRRNLVVPCEAEVGYNYKDLNKWKKHIPIIAEPEQMLPVREKTVLEQMTIVDLPKDTELDTRIYYAQEDKKLLRSFFLD